MSFDDVAAERLAVDSGFEVIDRLLIPGRSATRGPVPPGLNPRLRALLSTQFPDGIFSHQSRGLASALEGKDLCLATATASGKSLVFMVAAAHLLLEQPGSRVLALYPARALIQDQLGKWAELLSPVGLRHAFIDGSVPVAERTALVADAQVLLMTPDVCHAWLMRSLADPAISDFLRGLRLVILDEAHVYEGAFGTNMAFLLRRLEVASGEHQLICSTATLGQPHRFIRDLAGRTAVVLGPEDDGSPMAPKTILLLGTQGKKTFERTVELLVRCAGSDGGRFLAFGDSRRMVEQIVAACARRSGVEERSEDPDDAGFASSDPWGEEGDGWGETQRAEHRVLPYRAGYETEDRREIQRALAEGELAGVVSTSALELGLDIGDIDLVLLLDVPPSAKAFWQRVGRGGRRRAGVCIVIDARGFSSRPGKDLRWLTSRPLEPNWLYLPNRYIQYTNALCAADEARQLGVSDVAALGPYASLPEDFRRFLSNELNPTEGIPADLYPLKQRAQEDPHHEFPIRGSAEKTFKVLDRGRDPLGDLTFAQALREAFPGAVYYYMARAFRVIRFDYRRGEIHTKPERRYTTRPIAQSKVFPKFDTEVLALWAVASGFVAESEVQVSERVLGFFEQRGATSQEHRYGPGSPFSQRELHRFFQTTGVCWHFDALPCPEDVGILLLQAFAATHGIQERDLGVGSFHARVGPRGGGPLQGICIYDATQGSLRLTQRLAEDFAGVVEEALRAADPADAPGAHQVLERLLEASRDLKPVAVESVREGTAEGVGDEWVTVIAPGQRGILCNADGTREVEILAYRYTPKGLVYDLRHADDRVRWTVPAPAVQPIHGETRMLRVNLVTGEEEPAG